MWKTVAPTAIGNVPFTCFGYGQPGHKVADCPMKNTAPPTPTLARQAAAQGASHKPTMGPTYGRLTHLTMEDAQNALDVVYGMFLVHGSKASLLFDSSATCSYVSTKFA